MGAFEDYLAGSADKLKKMRPSSICARFRVDVNLTEYSYGTIDENNMFIGSYILYSDKSREIRRDLEDISYDDVIGLITADVCNIMMSADSDLFTEVFQKVVNHLVIVIDKLGEDILLGRVEFEVCVAESTHDVAVSNFSGK